MGKLQIERQGCLACGKPLDTPASERYCEDCCNVAEDLKQIAQMEKEHTRWDFPTARTLQAVQDRHELYELVDDEAPPPPTLVAKCSIIHVDFVSRKVTRKETYEY